MAKVFSTLKIPFALASTGGVLYDFVYDWILKNFDRDYDAVYDMLILYGTNPSLQPKFSELVAIVQA